MRKCLEDRSGRCVAVDRSNFSDAAVVVISHHLKRSSDFRQTGLRHRWLLGQDRLEGASAKILDQGELGSYVVHASSGKGDRRGPDTEITETSMGRFEKRKT